MLAIFFEKMSKYLAAEEVGLENLSKEKILINLYKIILLFAGSTFYRFQIPYLTRHRKLLVI